MQKIVLYHERDEFEEEEFWVEVWKYSKKSERYETAERAMEDFVKMAKDAAAVESIGMYYADYDSGTFTELVQGEDGYIRPVPLKRRSFADLLRGVLSFRFR